MHPRTLFMALLVPALLAAPAESQERRPERIEIRREGPRVWINGEEMTGRLGEFMQRRARLGVTVATDPRATDSIGAEIVAVTPGGPAAKAGIRSGDIITRLDGTAIVPTAAERRNAEVSPGILLTEIAARLEPNDTVAVEYSRGGRRTTTRLVTGDEPLILIGPNSFAFRTPDGGTRDWTFPELRVERFGPGFEAMGDSIEFRRMVGWGPLGDLELASINPDLASYFGVTEGVLVLNAPARSGLSLKGGDVILTIGGRRPTSPASLMRILRSYEPNETITMEIMRLKKRETITGKLAR